MDHDLEPSGSVDQQLVDSLRASHDLEMRSWSDRDWSPSSDLTESEDSPKAAVS